MRGRPLGPGAPDVSAVGFGGMRLSFPGRPEEGSALALLHAAFDAGITLVDTASSYCLDEDEQGHNERLIAQALGSWSGPRDGIVVATKGGIRGGSGKGRRDGRPEYLREVCHRSSRALGVDCITLYQLHAPDPKVTFADSVGALADLRRAGKIRFVGLSNVSLAEIQEAQAIVPIVTVQNRLNPYCQEDVSNGILAHCEESGIGYLAYSPVGGWLHAHLAHHPTLARISRRHGVSAHAVVLAWLMSLASTVIPIPSARSRERLVDWVAAVNLELGSDDLAAIGQAQFREPHPTLLQRIRGRLGRLPLVRKVWAQVVRREPSRG